ncbi:MAG: tetratricopeptide repeat protein, partial [bacterium]|nr:tetratricopeptide repeat protein [bacterium]
EVPVDEAVQALGRDLATRASWLMVLDNADEPAAIRSLLPPNTNGHVLVTTRATAPGIGGAEPIVVDVLPLEQATNFLLKRGRRPVSERAAARQLATALGRLPLALEQAGAYIARHQIAASAYLASFEKRRLDLLDRLGPEQGDYAATVATTWEISFQRVKQASLAAAEALWVCGFLAPDRIPVQLFVGTGDRLGPALGALAQELAAKPLALHEGLVEPLTRYSLARFDPEDGGHLSLHRLVQEVIRRRLQDAGRESEVYEQGHRALEACFPKDPESPEAWPEASLWLPHVQTLLAGWLEQSEEPEWDPTSLWHQAARYAWAAGRAVEARKLGEAALSVSRRLLGEEHPDTQTSMNNLANTLSDLGDAAG